MKQKKKIKHKVIKFGEGKLVALGKYDKGYSLVLERPLEDIDNNEAPQFAKIVDGKILTNLGITDEAMDNIVHLYNEYKNESLLYNTLELMTDLLVKAVSENDSNKHTT